MAAKAFPHFMMRKDLRSHFVAKAFCEGRVFHAHVLCRMKLTQNLAKPFAKAPLTCNIISHPHIGKFVWGEKVAKASRRWLSPRPRKKTRLSW